MVKPISQLNLLAHTVLGYVVAIVLVVAAPQASAAQSCYKKIGSSSPPPKGTTLVLLDITTPGDAAAVASLNGVAGRLLRHKGERILIATFAGLASGEHPRIVLEAYQEPSPDSRFQENQVIEKTDILNSCLPKLWASNTAAVLAALKNHTNGGGDSGIYSEIAFAMRWAAKDILPTLAAPVGQPATSATLRVLVFSDGYLHSRTKQSFYLNKQPRQIAPAKELAILKSTGLALPGDAKLPMFDLYWIGVGSLPTAKKVYSSPAEYEALVDFWTQAAKLYGAKNAKIGLTLRADEVK
jgi:hypothetical protein